MPKYLSGRSKRRSQDKLTEDRYLYLGVDQTEPNLGDPPEADAIPSGTKYQIVSLIDRPGERFWQEVGGGLVPGSITVRDEGTVIPKGGSSPNLGISTVTDLNFVGVAVTVVGFIKPDGNAGSAVTITISPPGNDNEILFNDDGEFATSTLFKFDNSTVGVASVGIGTTQPTQNLHVAGNFRLEGIFFDEDNSAGAQTDLLVKTATGGLKYASANAIRSGAGGTIYDVQFHNTAGLVDGASTNGGKFVYRSDTDRVGIGSTQPDRLLDVLGNSRFTGITTFVGITTFTDDVTFLTLNNKNIFFDRDANDFTFGDSVKAKFGSNKDTSIYHNDTDFYIDNSKGNIFLRVNDTETALKAIPNGGVEIYFNDEKKIETVGGGVTVIGDFGVSGISTFAKRVAIGSHLDMPNDARIRLGLNDDLEIVRQGNGDSLIKENGPGDLKILGSDIIFKNSGDTKTYAEFKDNSSVNLFFNNIKKFETTGAGITVTGLTSTTDFAVTGVVTSNIIPSIDNFFDLGSPTLRWNNIYAKEIISTIEAEFEFLNVTGVTTTKNLNVTGVGTIKDLIVEDLYVSGLSTFVGVSTQQSTLFTTQLDAIGLSTFREHVLIDGTKKLRFGDSNAQIYRNNQHLYIDVAGNHDFYVRTNSGGGVGGQIYLQPKINENGIVIHDAGSVDLYYNAAKKFSTNGIGVSIFDNTETGSINVSGVSTFVGISTQESTLFSKQISNAGVSTFFNTVNVKTAGGSVIQDASGTLDIRANILSLENNAGVATFARFSNGGTAQLWYNNEKKLETSGAGVTVTGLTSTSMLAVTGVSTFFGDLLPSDTEVYNIGKDATLRWNKVYAAEYYGTFKGSIDPGIAVGKADTVKITDDTSTSATHYIHFGDDATTNNYDAVEVDSTGLTYENKVLIPSRLNAGITTIGTLIVTGISTFNDYLHVGAGISVVGVVTATDFNSTSDIKLKTNIQVIDNPIDKVMKIDGVSFNWKDTNKPSFGVIADNIEEVLPDLVSNTDPKSVNYNGLVGLLIEVVKNQQEQINELRSLLDK